MEKQKERQRQRQKQRQHQPRRHGRTHAADEEDPLPSSAFDAPAAEAEEEENVVVDLSQDAGDSNLKHILYQQAVQSPKGDISYLQKFFLMYIGGRIPLHLLEDFCGTALICAEWVRGDARRTAVGIDLDEDTLAWGLQNNIRKLGIDAYGRSRLLCGNVLQPISKARSFKFDELNLASLCPSIAMSQATLHEDFNDKENNNEEKIVSSIGSFNTSEREVPYATMPESMWPNADIVCALNYSCCCLHKRKDLVAYFKRVLDSLSMEGGVFVLDIYGGTSSECAMKLRRRYDEFLYIWEQDDFDVVTRTTRISLHFQLNKSHRMLRHAFTYRWRLWTLPELRDCLEEVGFGSVHVWIRKTPEANDGDEVEANTSIKFEEVSGFLQQHSWNAYVVAVKHLNSQPNLLK